MSDTVTLSKDYGDFDYYNNAYFYTQGQSLSVEIDSVLVNDDFDSSSGNNILSRPRSKSNYRYGSITRIIDMLSVNHQITVQGSIRDDSDTESTSTLTNINGANITVDDASSFSSTDGVIQINNELIYYATKSGNVLQTCRRAYAHTVQPSVEHSYGSVVYDRTTSAINKKYILELFRRRGGTVKLDWRIFQYNVFITAMGFKDTKTKHTGNFSRAVAYDVTLTARVGYMKGEEPSNSDL